MEFSEALGASYRLQTQVGRGASGEVWRATDTRTGETVAAKLLRPEHASDPALVERFVRERSILTGLRHPNIVAVRDLVVEGDRLAIVMDYIGGGSLRDVLDAQSNLPPQAAAGTTAAVFGALAAAHEKRILHRDIKPDNVLLLPEWLLGRPDACKVTDFGIARMITDRHRVSTGLLGTPEYMAPELISTGNAGMPADVYAAGILLYELLAGRTPFAGPGTDFTVAYRHVQAMAPELELPGDLTSLLRRLLDKNPQRRPSAADAAAELSRLAGQLSGMPALEPTAAPDEFAQTDRPATALRGIQPSDEASSTATPDEPPELGPIPDLGTPGRQTVYRPVLRRPVTEPEAEPAEAKEPQAVWWKAPRVIAAGAAAVLLLIALAVVAVRLGPRHPQLGPTPNPKPVTFQAIQQDQPTPTGLGISRNATYDSSSASIRLTITYSAQKATLRGPFLEVLPGVTKNADCPTLTWPEEPQQQNLPSITGITARCAWSIDGIEVPAQSSAQLAVEVHQRISSQEQLQNWLDRAAAATTAAVSDPDVSGTAYPVQRLQDIQVQTPSRIVSQKTLPITLIPVWPGGADSVDPLYKSPSIGDPAEMLVAIAGGEDGIRFSDGCSGALSVSGDGLTVTTLSQATECTVDARVGNFTDLASSPFSIVTRGG